eukprot:6209994-Pleurochrysis_carterae.AAC.4
MRKAGGRAAAGSVRPPRLGQCFPRRCRFESCAVVVSVPAMSAGLNPLATLPVKIMLFREWHVCKCSFRPSSCNCKRVNGMHAAAARM